MTVSRAKVTSKGQITLPRNLREKLGIVQGDHVEFSIDSENGVQVRKIVTPGSSAGVLRHLARDRPVSPQEMDNALREKAREDFRGS